MKVKEKLLRRLLDEYVMSGAEFAREMGVDAAEVEKLLNGEAVGADTGRRFIGYVGYAEAGRLIDWRAMGKKNPFAVCRRADSKMSRNGKGGYGE